MFKQFSIPFFILIFLLVIQGCSWVVNFYIANQTKNSIKIELELDDTIKGFGIFHNSGIPTTVYKVNEYDKIDFSENLNITCSKIWSKNHFQIILPPQTAYVIGSLSNDKYTSYDQYFINGRVFNLKQLKIISALTKVIVPKTFDENFKNENGNGIFLRILD